eukprot:symbB.v1.2.001130.t1/scaffold46.1/size430244/21
MPFPNEVLESFNQSGLFFSGRHANISTIARFLFQKPCEFSVQVVPSAPKPEPTKRASVSSLAPPNPSNWNLGNEAFKYKVLPQEENV